LANIRVILGKNSEPAAEKVKNARSTGISPISRYFDIREEQGASFQLNWDRSISEEDGGSGLMSPGPLPDIALGCWLT
jgi:hypothetical protein